MRGSSRVVGSLARLSLQVRSPLPISSRRQRSVLTITNGTSSPDEPLSTNARVQYRWKSSTRTNRRERFAEKVVIHRQDEGDDDDEEDDENIDDDDESSGQPWKTLLMAPARAAWRVAEPQLPPALDETLQGILKNGNRTPNQLKRAHRKVLEIHSTMAELRERERRRLVNGKYYRGKDATATATAGDEDSSLPVIYGYDETLGTLKHRLYPNYVIAKRVLRECQSLVDIQPQRIVDFGIGCGSASAAALNVFRDDIDWIHGIDPSQPMRECSRRLIEGLVEKDGGARVPQITFSTGFSTETSSSTSATSQGSFDLALFTYTATDLPDITSTLAAAALLFQKLKPNGVFVMIEPGTPDGFNSIRAVRNMLLDCCPPDDPEFPGEERCKIIAPCTHNGECPMVRHKKDFVKKKKFAHDLPQEQDRFDSDDIEDPSDTDSDTDDEDGQDYVEMSSNSANLSEFDAFNASFCSFVQTMPGSKLKKGEKFSYLVAQKKIYGKEEQGSNPLFGKEDDLAKLLAKAQAAVMEKDSNGVQEIFRRVQDLESRYIDSEEDILGLELVKGDAKRESMGRIVRAPIKKKGHVYIDYCTAPGRIIRNRIAKSSTHVAPGMWNAARKSRWGGFWPDTMDKIYFHNK